MTNFASLGLAEPLLRALAHEGYDAPTPIQSQAIPPLMEGRDLLGIAQTGTGKTAAFSLPILHRLRAENKKAAPREARVLVLAPTRELAAQIGDSFRAYGRFMPLSVAVVVGGVSAGPQVRAMSRGVDVLVATPGRLLDHMQTGAISLSGTHVVVLDEADHMLDLGFIEPIKRIMKAVPSRRQTLLFSATMPREIAGLADERLSDPVKVSVTPAATTAERVAQCVWLVDAGAKKSLLVELMADPAMSRVLVFTRTKHGADKVAKHLDQSGIQAAAIHGNKSQGQRERALDCFKDGDVRVLVATDIAARGIDVDGVSHVVNYELPNVPEAYVHRIGRTARAGNGGQAIAFCDGSERSLLKDIEKATRQQIPVAGRRQATEEERASAPSDRERGQRPPRGQNQGRGGQGRSERGFDPVRQDRPERGPNRNEHVRQGQPRAEQPQRGQQPRGRQDQQQQQQQPAQGPGAFEGKRPAFMSRHNPAAVNNGGGNQSPRRKDDRRRG